VYLGVLRGFRVKHAAYNGSSLEGQNP